MRKPTDNVGADEILETLVLNKVVSGDDARSFQETNQKLSQSRFEEILRELAAAGLLSDFQKRRIDADGIESLRVGPYVLLEHLGRGGMGEVLLARHVELDRNVALKILPPRLTDSDERRERFRREIRLLARLDHAGIVKAIDAGHWKDVPYLAMEYVEGGTLQDLLAKEGPIAWNRLVRWMIPICEALDYAHQQGVIHRDIKPSNMAVDKVKGIKVLDLGLARATQVDGEASTDGFATSADQILGTADFLPPEQSVGESEVTPAADVYSLGCSMFTLLTARPIFPGGSVLEKVVSHRKAPPPSLSELRPEVPKELDQLINSMVSKQPDQRPPSMQDVAKRLDEIAVQYHLGDSTVPAIGTGSDATTANTSRPGALPQTASQGTGEHGSPKTSPRIQVSQREISPLKYLLLGIAATVMLLCLGALAVPLLRIGEWTGAAENSAMPLSPKHGEGTMTEKVVPVEAERPSEQDSDGALSLSTLFSTVQLAGGVIELPAPPPRGELKSISSDEVPRTLPAGARFGIRFSDGAPTLQLQAMIARAPNLERLTIWSDERDSVSLATLSEAETLQELTLDARSFPASELVWLRKSLGLRTLVVSHTEPTHIDRIVTLDQVVDLSLPSGRLGDNSVLALSQMTSLQRLSFPIEKRSPEAVYQLLTALPQCELEFQSDTQSQLSDLLLNMGTMARGTSHEEVLRERMKQHQQELVRAGGLESYLGLFRYAGLSSELLTRTEQIEVLKQVTDLNARLQASTEDEKQLQRLRRQAAHKKLILGKLMLMQSRRHTADQAEDAIAQLQASIELNEELGADKHFERLADGAAEIARAYSSSNPELAKQWCQRTLRYLSMDNGSRGSTVVWAWRHLGDAASAFSVAEATQYYQTAVSMSKSLPAHEISRFDLEYVHRLARLLLQQSEFAECAKELESGFDLLDKMEGSPATRVDYRRRFLCLSAVIALAEQNRRGFIDATNSLVAILVNGGKNTDIWDIVCLRAWINPLSPTDILMPSGRAGSWPQVARELACGNLELQSFNKLKLPSADSIRYPLHQALAARLNPSESSDADRERAQELWAESSSLNDPVYRILLEAALGPLLEIETVSASDTQPVE